MSEAKLKRKFREVVGVWSEAYETRSGGGVGYPDLQLLVHSILVPVELKKGVIKDGRLYPSEIRPSQIAWHHDFFVAGGRSHIVCLFEVAKQLEAWAIPGTSRVFTSWWRSGYDMHHCTRWVGNGKLAINLAQTLPALQPRAFLLRQIQR